MKRSSEYTTTGSATTRRPPRRRFKRARNHDRVASALKALGDDTRLAIMQMISEAGELCSCDIEQHFALSQPTISHHLKLLRSAGLITGTRRGTWIYYRVIPKTLSTIAAHPVLARTA